MKTALLRALWEADEMPRIPRKPDQDLRDYPTYTIPEAAIYLAVPRRTLYHWVSDMPLWESAGRTEHTRLLSFRDVAQSYFLEFIRRHAGISTSKVREILKNAQMETNEAYPLLGKDIKILFKSILLDKAG